MKTLAGYHHPLYAASLAEFGTPRELLRSGGWILERAIPATPFHDAMGCYPLFTCANWSELGDDLDDLRDDGLVSLALVTDPFGAYDPDDLRRCMPDVMVPFKQHFVVDLRRPPETFVVTHHRRYARRALQALQIERCEDPARFVAHWVELYANLTRRHRIRGLTAFSEASFLKQLKVPGLIMFRAFVDDDHTVGMILWYRHDAVAYYHLGAYDARGYTLHASFGLFWFAIHHFTTAGVRWLDLGAGAGITRDTSDGLTRFKRGWSTGTRTTYFCGRIFNPSRYAALAAARDAAQGEFFPAYRFGEFA
jgi:hypothetical protein